MLAEMSRIIGRVTSGPPPKRFHGPIPKPSPRSPPRQASPLDGTARAELPIRAASPEAYIAAGQEHPMSLAVRPVVERAGVADQVRAAMTAVLRDANEDPDGFLVHSPYAVHTLRIG